MTITYYPELIQGSEEWLAARRGLLTASEMKHVLTPPLPRCQGTTKAGAQCAFSAADGLTTCKRHIGQVGRPDYAAMLTVDPLDNDKTRSHAYELLAQRISGYVEPSYISDDMLRGMSDEIDARLVYSEHVAPVEDMGFITNDRWGFTLGYSPDGMVGDDGAIEAKGRRQKFQVQTMCEHVATGCLTIPEEFVLQIQPGLLVSERK